jgi:hypothetical protein
MSTKNSNLDELYVQGVLVDAKERKGYGVVFTRGFSEKDYASHIYFFEGLKAKKIGEKFFSEGNKKNNYQRGQEFIRSVFGKEALPFDCDGSRIVSPSLLVRAIEDALKNHLDFS